MIVSNWGFFSSFIGPASTKCLQTFFYREGAILQYSEKVRDLMKLRWQSRFSWHRHSSQWLALRLHHQTCFRLYSCSALDHSPHFGRYETLALDLYMDMPDRNLSLTHTHTHIPFDLWRSYIALHLFTPFSPTPLTKHLPTNSLQHCSDLMDESFSLWPVLQQNAFAAERRVTDRHD
jgi:hypothetical protein